MRNFIVASLALLAATLVSTSCSVKAEPAPSFRLQNLDGKSVELSDFKGKVVILDFWATWCPPCRAEIPNFIDLQKKYLDKGLQVIGISVDQGGPGVVSSFVKQEGINYPILMGTDDVASKYGNIQAIPTTFIIDQKGNIVGKHEGFTDKDTFEKEITALLPSATASN